MQTSRPVEDTVTATLDAPPQAEDQDAPSKPANEFDFDEADRLDKTPKQIDGIFWRGQEYVLRRCNEDAAVRFTNARMRALHFDDDKLVGLRGGADVEPLLVSMCLFKVHRREDGNVAWEPVSEKHLRQFWPPHYVAKLYAKAKEVCHIDVQQPKARAQKIKDLEKELAKERAQARKEAGLAPVKLIEVAVDPETGEQLSDEQVGDPGDKGGHLDPVGN
jgi:hypothetical protein